MIHEFEIPKAQYNQIQGLVVQAKTAAMIRDTALLTAANGIVGAPEDGLVQSIYEKDGKYLLVIETPDPKKPEVVK